MPKAAEYFYDQLQVLTHFRSALYNELPSHSGVFDPKSWPKLFQNLLNLQTIITLLLFIQS
ncbi:hypothetical protein WN55_00319 [Dufourea novaeangliae]|uniref:Uncharacterized protein n=1 Tax=Dufourea novaeangliae TaxID=178035 RepID=A0A154PCD7_DUFNO|nr:hypothetical protein WN55_00319 [Dufourea novaeangliae]